MLSKAYADTFTGSSISVLTQRYLRYDTQRNSGEVNLPNRKGGGGYFPLVRIMSLP